jgi:hypothetical protein
MKTADYASKRSSESSDWLSHGSQLQGRSFGPQAEQTKAGTGGIDLLKGPLFVAGMPVRAKLPIGEPNDKYEQEADRVAGQVMLMPDGVVQGRVQREGLPEEEELQMKPVIQREELPEEEEELQMKPLVQREELPEEEEELQMKPVIQREGLPEEEEELQMKPVIQREALPEEEEELQMKPMLQREELPEEEEELQMKPLVQREALPEEEEELQMKADFSGQSPIATASLEDRLNSSKGSGSPLSEDVRSFMEPRFGADFSGVRVHTGSEAVQMNQAVGAQAFAHGRDVYFGAGKGPRKDSLTAHELTHVVQQTGRQHVQLNRKSLLREVDFIGNTFELLAKLNFSVPLCKELIDHYCHGEGSELGLTALGMSQCNALIDFGDSSRSPQFLRFVNQMGAEIARNDNGDPSKPKKSIESDVSFDMLGSCNTSGTLGNFTVNSCGKLKVWNPNEDGTDADWSFEGNMWWHDLWDFDRQAPSRKDQPGRTEKGEWRTTAGSLLVGTPFHIQTASVPVRQVRADARGGNHYAKWAGNPDGIRLPVVSGIL